MIDWDNPLQVPFNTPQPLHSPQKREIYNFKKLKEFTLEPMFMEGCGQLRLDTLLTLDIRYFFLPFSLLCMFLCMPLVSCVFSLYSLKII